jgi:hypothetical protein
MLRSCALIASLMLLAQYSTAHAQKKVTATWKTCFGKAQPTSKILGGVELPPDASFIDDGSALQWNTARVFKFAVRGKSQREVGQFLFNQKLLEVPNQPAADMPRSVFQLSADSRSQLTVQCDTAEVVSCTFEFRFAEPIATGRNGCPSKLTAPAVPVPRAMVAAPLPAIWSVDYRNSTVADWQKFFVAAAPTEPTVGLPLHPLLKFDAAASAAPSQRGAKRGRFTYVFSFSIEKLSDIESWYATKFPAAEQIDLENQSSVLRTNDDEQLLFSCSKKSCSLTMSLVRSNNTSDYQNLPRHAGPR